MQDDQEICTKCGAVHEDYGYCAKDGDPYCENCWPVHVADCEECSIFELED